SCPAQYSLYFCKLFCSRRYLTSFPTRRSSDLTIQTQLNTLGDFRPVVPKHFLRADVMMLGNLHPNTQLGVIRQMEKRPKLIILDTMNFWMDNSWDEIMQVIAEIDVITINDQEARQLTKEHSLVKAAAKIQEMGPRYVVIKKGEHGALL